MKGTDRKYVRPVRKVLRNRQFGGLTPFLCCPGKWSGLKIWWKYATTITVKLIYAPNKNMKFFLLHMYIIRGEFNKFPDFFVQPFKIVVDTWKFSILLLYILWDDWPIFRISGSNQQLQQQLECTLLKPDCHSWWISKMQSGREETLEERYAIKFYFELWKNATETYGMLQIAFRPSCMNRAWVFEWHKRFKEGRQSVRDDGRCGRSKEVNTPELIGQTVRVRLRVTMLRF